MYVHVYVIPIQIYTYVHLCMQTYMHVAYVCQSIYVCDHVDWRMLSPTRHMGKAAPHVLISADKCIITHPGVYAQTSQTFHATDFTVRPNKQSCPTVPVQPPISSPQHRYAPTPQHRPNTTTPQRANTPTTPQRPSKQQAHATASSSSSLARTQSSGSSPSSSCSASTMSPNMSFKDWAKSS